MHFCDCAVYQGLIRNIIFKIPFFWGIFLANFFILHSYINIPLIWIIFTDKEIMYKNVKLSNWSLLSISKIKLKFQILLLVILFWKWKPKTLILIKFKTSSILIKSVSSKRTINSVLVYFEIPDLNLKNKFSTGFTIFIY